jgi:hypothetical protein
MTFQETLQHLSPTVKAQLQPFLDILQLRLSPTDWKRMLTFIGSMDPERRAALMAFLAQRETHAPAVGTEAPDFELPRLGSDERVRLSGFRNHKPVALIFGSFSWPPFRAQAGHLETLYQRFGDHMAFFVIYIREAHPTDEWLVESNEHDNVLYTQPTTMEERTGVASACALRLDLTIPMLIDDLDNSTDRQYYALPDRLYLVGRDGYIVYRGLPGPFGFIVAELEKAIEGYLAEDRSLPYFFAWPLQ